MRFYYHQLTEKNQKLYQLLKNAVESHSEECVLYDMTLTREHIGDIIAQVLLDYPDYYWTKGDFYLYREENSFVQYLRIKIIYLFDEEQCKKLDERISKRIAKCCEYVDQRLLLNPREIILQVCNWIYQNTEYACTGDEDQTIYSVFCDKKSVCMGISKAAALILRLYDIRSIVTMGKLFGQHPHSWLIVLVDGRYYHLDIALGYPCFDELWYRYHDLSDRYCILKSDEWMKGTHVLDERYVYPICGGDL